MFPIKIHQGGPVQEERDIEQKNLSKVGLEPSTSNSCGAYSTATNKNFGLFWSIFVPKFWSIAIRVSDVPVFRDRCDLKKKISCPGSEVRSPKFFGFFGHLRRMTRENRKVSSPWREPSASASAAPKNPKHLSTKRNFKLKLGWNLKRKTHFKNSLFFYFVEFRQYSKVLG